MYRRTINKYNFPMKYFYSLLTVLLTIMATLGYSQAINDPNVVVRQTETFNSIVISSAIDVVLTQSNSTAVAVSASDPKIVENITTEVRNNTLYIGYKGSAGWGPKYLRAYISSPDFLKIGASGACNVRIEGNLRGNDLEVSLSGSSDFKGNVSVTNLKLIASGSSDISISGTTTNLRVDVSGSSDVKAFDLQSDYADVSASGASDINITVNKELKVAASGASDVYYKGTAIIKEISTSGASDIKKRS